MCGITGIFERQSNNILNIGKILNKINHRGPDANGIWNDNDITLGSVRLKVVDLDDKSNQPFISYNKRFVIVFNGEIYNFKSIKKKYNIKSITNSDTEIIVELFSKVGPKAFSLLDGMFAIAIYDKITKKLFVARDPFGIKPLYFYINRKKFIFCSEIKGIREIYNNGENKNSVIDLVKWGGLDHSSNTWFKNIFSVEPGSYHIINKEFNMIKEKYYRLEDNINKNKFKNKDIPNYFSYLLKKSIKTQSQTVRSIGTNLSGGVDSSIVTAFLREYKPNLKTYTFGYNEKKYDERLSAKKIADKLNVMNFTSITSSKIVNSKFIDTLIMQDEPFTSFRQVSHHKLYSDFKNNGSTVIIEASGGDEIGAGYTGFLWPFFLDEVKENGVDIAWKNLTDTLKSHKFNEKKILEFVNSGINNQNYYGSTTSDGKKIIDDDCILDGYSGIFKTKHPSYIKKFTSNLLNSQYIELFHTKLPRGIRYIDRASSSSGREARVPLLSKEIVEFCFSISNENKIKNGELRYFMKKSFNFLVKKNMNLGNKKSIADPQKIWIRKNFKTLFLNVFNSRKFKNRGIFNSLKVIENFQKFIKDDSSNSLGIFQIFITEIWFRLFIDNNPDQFKGIELDEFINETNN